MKTEDVDTYKLLLEQLRSFNFGLFENLDDFLMYLFVNDDTPEFA